MRLELDNLPSDVGLLHQLVRDMASLVETRNDEIERLQAIITKLQRMQFGRRSERLDPDQLALGLEDLDADIARIEENGPVIAGDADAVGRRPHRAPLPDHLEREEVVIDAQHEACPCCGGALHSMGESVSEMLDWVPAKLRVIRTTRPKYACRTCGSLVQAPAPERVIAGGLATPALLTQVLVSKYCDHTPLYRQSRIFARHGMELSRSTLGGWVGGACWWLEALHERDHGVSNHLGLLKVVGVRRLITILDHLHPGIAVTDQAIAKRNPGCIPGTGDGLNPLILQIILEKVPGQLMGEFEALDQTLLLQLAQIPLQGHRHWDSGY